MKSESCPSCMKLPKDPIILLSFVNTQLRDNYLDLADFCSAAGITEEELCAKLATVGYEYREEVKQFR